MVKAFERRYWPATLRWLNGLYLFQVFIFLTIFSCVACNLVASYYALGRNRDGADIAYSQSVTTQTE